MKMIILFVLLISQFSFADELSLYFIPSPKGMDWSSPSKLATSALKNKLSFKPHFMGHVWVEIKCGNTHELTGMVGKNFDYLNQLLIEQRGLGVLYHSFEGRLEDKKDIQEEMEGYFKEGGMNFVKLLLNDKQCKRAAQYLKEYREKDVGRYYGLANRPRYGEGAGCTAFGASFLEVLDLLEEDMKLSWFQAVNIPMELAGPPIGKEGVGLFKVMFNSDRWASDNENHQKIYFWNPDSMYSWVERKSKTDGKWKVEMKGKVTGIVSDKSHLPVKEGPIWEQMIDAKTRTVITDHKKTDNPPAPVPK